MSQRLLKTNIVLKIVSKDYKLKRKRQRFVVVSNDGRKTEIAVDKVYGIILYENGIITTSALALAMQKRIPIVSFYKSTMLLLQPPDLFIKPELIKAQSTLSTKKAHMIASKMVKSYIDGLHASFENIFGKPIDLKFDANNKINTDKLLYQLVSETESRIFELIPNREKTKNNLYTLFQTLKTLLSHHILISLLKQGLHPCIAFVHPEKNFDIPLAFDISLEIAPATIFPLTFDLANKYTNPAQIPLPTLLKIINNLLDRKFIHPMFNKPLSLQKIIDVQTKSLAKSIATPIASYNPLLLSGG